MRKDFAAIAVLLVLVACGTSPTGRNQLKLMSGEDMAQMGAAAYDEMKQQPTVQDASVVRYVNCVADAVTAILPAEYQGGWEVTVFEDDSANAFALPGRKIGVHSGLLDVAVNQSQLATVIGHEIAHVIADHGNERVSMQFAAQTGQQVLGALLGSDPATRDMVMGALGVGAQYGLLMPYGRTQESESDALGLDYMARAGFDPNASVELWQNMSAASEGQPPEFLSTHPSHGSRIEDLRDQMPAAQELYRQARAQGRTPDCG